MDSVGQKLKRNLKNGTFFKNVPIAIRNRFIKRFRTSNLLYFFNKERVLTKKYQKDIRKIGNEGVEIGNYYLHARIPLNDKSIVYSLGILTDISFDVCVQKKYGCPIFMYDPTPASIEFMKQHASNTLLKFFPVGVWIEDTTLRFYEPKHGGSSSVMADVKEGKYFDAPCLTMTTIMRQNNHTHISVFKADIEGAALPILHQMVQQRIFPDQIVVEFERPTNNMTKVQQYFKDVSGLRSSLKENGYEEFLLPRYVAKYYSLELLFVKKDKIQ